MRYYSRRNKKMQSSIQSRGMARKTIEVEHSKIHDGRGYDTDVEIELIGTTPQYFHLETGDSQIHLKDIELTTNKANVQCFLLINPTVTKNESPTELTIFNSDVTSNNICSMKMYSNSIVSADGTKRKNYFISGTQSVGNIESGSSRASDEWELILDTNSDYLIKILRTVVDGNTKVVFRLKMYEETP